MLKKVVFLLVALVLLFGAVGFAVTPALTADVPAQQSVAATGVEFFPVLGGKIDLPVPCVAWNS